MILIIAILTGCIDSNTPRSDQQVQSSQKDEGQISQVTPAATGIPSSTVKQGDVPNIYDIYGNKVNPNDIIVVSRMPISYAPLRLVREGIIDIEVKYNDIDIIGSPDEITKVNKIPDPSIKQTFLRVRFYDETGKVMMFKPSKFESQQELIDHPADADLSYPKTRKLYEPASVDIGGIKEWEFFIYFVDINKIPTPVPQKTINI